MKRRPLPSSYRRLARLLTPRNLTLLPGTPPTPPPAPTPPRSPPPPIAPPIRPPHRST